MAEFSSVARLIAVRQVECLNEDSTRSALRMFSYGKPLKSDIDAQLLISVPFHSPVKLAAIRIVPTDNIDAAPACVKIFSNKVSLDFADAESLAAIQTIAFEDIGKVVPLKYVLFQNVVSVQLFVESNKGDVDQTEIANIEFFGTAGENMNMKEFNKSEHNHD